MSNIMPFKFSLHSLTKQDTIHQIMATNTVSCQYGLSLNEEDAEQIFMARQAILKNLGRVEISTGVISQLITIFCRSPFISQENYAAAVIDLMEAFYYIKNETRDEIGDLEIIELMKERFDTRCGGSIELLVSQGMEDVIQAARQGHYYRTLSGEDNEVSK